MRTKLIVATIGLALSGAGASLHASEAERLPASGVVDTSFDGIDPAGIAVSINGVDVVADENGQYEADLPLAPYYQVRFEGPAIHTSVQTFGVSEVYGKDCNCLRIPEIEVVARKEGRIELIFAGDAMAGRRYIDPIWGERQLIDPADPLEDITALLEPMRPYIETADLASVNLEIVLSKEEFANSPPKSVIFYAPPELAEALAQAGFDHVSLGNNHSYDYLEEGLVATIEAVEKAGLAWSGAGLDEHQALLASQLDVADQPLSLLGYVGWKGRVEPNQIAEVDKGGAAFGSDANIAASVAREVALGRHVIAQYHGSNEYSEGPTEDSERRMKLAVDNGAALVASHHPHVAHGLELYNDALIAYSTGNFLFDQYFLETHGSFVFRAWMEHGKVIRAEVIPIRVLDYRPVPAVGSMREAILGRVTRLSAERATLVDRNGGHGVIVPRHKDAAQADDTEQSCPVATDIFRAGDFENAVFGDATDRSLKLENGSFVHVFEGGKGHVLSLRPDEGSGSMTLMPSTFFRVIPGDTVTVSGKIRASRDISLGLATQDRPKGMARFKALREAPVEQRLSMSMSAGEAWQDFALTFKLDVSEDSIAPFRPMLGFAAKDGSQLSGAAIAIDDLRVDVALPPDCN